MLYSENVLIKTIRENGWMKNATLAQLDAVIKASNDEYPTVAIASMIYAYSQDQSELTLPGICQKLNFLIYTNGNEEADRIRQEYVREWLNTHDRSDLTLSDLVVKEIADKLFDVLDDVSALFAPADSYEECIEIAVMQYVHDDLKWNKRMDLDDDEFEARYEYYRFRKSMYMLTDDDISAVRRQWRIRCNGTNGNLYDSEWEAQKAAAEYKATMSNLGLYGHADVILVVTETK